MSQELREQIDKFKNWGIIKEDISNTLQDLLLSFGGEKVKLGLDSEEEIQKMLTYGILFDTDVTILHGEIGRCHRNVASKYIKEKSKGFRIVTGYALSDGVWYQHSWGINKKGSILETTKNEYSKYYGYILDKDESEDFCFNNY